MSEAMIETLDNTLGDLNWEERLIELCKDSDQNIAFSTSLSYEDQAITHVIASNDLPIKVFTLDTGRLFEETHKLAQDTLDRYPNIDFETFYPDAIATQDMVQKQGINGFFDSVEKRKNCCYVRKVEPLNRALHNVDIWVSGLRRAHSGNRDQLPIAQMDEARNTIKFYPLIDVEEQDLKDFIHTHNIPYNALHDRGFPSIGCAPCTRAVVEGEDTRAGRWWWEQDNTQECGLHIVDGKLVRIKG